MHRIVFYSIVLDTPESHCRERGGFMAFIVCCMAPRYSVTMTTQFQTIAGAFHSIDLCTLQDSFWGRYGNAFLGVFCISQGRPNFFEAGHIRKYYNNQGLTILTKCTFAPTITKAHTYALQLKDLLNYHHQYQSMAFCQVCAQNKTQITHITKCKISQNSLSVAASE